MSNEKSLLTISFLLFFILSAVLMSVMIKKDLHNEENKRLRMQENTFNNRPENSWPKVEIEVRK